MTDQENPEGRSHGRGSGTEMVYRVEVRSTYTQAEEVNGLLLDQRWQVVPTVASGPIGVPNDVFSPEARRQGFLSYNAALALMFWFIASAKRSYCVQTRLVKIEFSHGFSTKEVGVSLLYAPFAAEREAIFTAREGLESK